MSIFGNIKTGEELAWACLEVAKNYKTLYVTGCFGWPMTNSNKARVKQNYSANRKEPRVSNINKASKDTFGFDCVNIIKGLLWGWNGNVNDVYGGAKYQANGVPDIDEGTMFNSCTNKSSDFNNIEVGEACWMQGHIGIYVGNGLCVECTPAWSNNVQVTACNRDVPGYNRRNWTQHGKLPYVTYTGKNDESIKPAPAPKPTPAPDTTNTKRELHKGDKGEDVKQLQKDLIELGYNLGQWGADGDFGDMTDKAVRDFQQKSGLVVDGWAGEKTFAALEAALAEVRNPAPAPAPAPTPAPSTSLLRLGSKGAEVVELQKKLLALNYDLAPWGADGDFGYKTEAAVRDFQQKNNLEVDGIVGSATNTALDKAMATITTNATYKITVTAQNLNVRKGPGTNYPVVMTIAQGGVYTIVDEKDGWGKLKSGAGWISLNYTRKI